MNKIAIAEFKLELKRFNKKLKDYEDRIVEDQEWNDKSSYRCTITRAPGTKQSAALKRAALDLSESLRVLRKR